MELRLRPLTQDDEQQAELAQRELAADRFGFLVMRDRAGSWADYLSFLDSLRTAGSGTFVRHEQLVAEVDGVIVGRTSIRFELNDALREVGGHVGYGVRPAHRRRGYAAEMLRRSLDILRADGLDRALVTCDDDNAGSAATIERCGGVFERFAAGTEHGRQRRYWIALDGSAASA